MQIFSRCIPNVLPKRMRRFRDDYEHHLVLKISKSTALETETKLREIIGEEGWFTCTSKEAKKAFLHRFAAAGAAIRYQAIHEKKVDDIIALDVALRRNDENWLETLPPELESQLIAKLYYGHFFCHVFHQDYVVRRGADTAQIKQALLELMDQRGAEYPAEHNVGHLYAAKSELAEFYQSLDPTNSFNPGIGKTSKQKNVVHSGQSPA